MKQLIIMAVIVLSAFGTSIAQQGPGNRQRMTEEQRVEQTISNLKQKVTLSDSQWSDLRVIYTDFYKESAAMRGQSGTRPDPEQMKKLQENKNAKIKALVGEENFKKIQEAERNNMGGARSRGARKG
ncbi:hypothetical protein [Rufibacter roseus]|uniref:DUF4890 domain-containing protein n=1 Tax=Rufibacter roseus TaxID=1567108 RepID=A0ABW2DQC4_9BACT|nr:hypothetical protein [Rufibacter roseus]